ncbi:MAG TPA: hypothetical protein VH253_12020 [Phycisphaerae bacterium]|nr:hypothetical protein [Phycisphaerae bacterium]
MSQVLEGEPFVNGHGRHPLVRLVTRERLAGDPEYVHACRSAAVGEAHAPPAGTARPAGEAVGVDFLFMTDGDAWSPEDVFGRLRWGGQAILLSDHRTAIETAAAAYKHWRGGGGGGAWAIEQPPAVLKRLPGFLRLLGLRTRAYFLIVRKIALIPPGFSSDRFTYNVTLARPEAARAGAGAGGGGLESVAAAHSAGRGGSVTGGGYEVVKQVPATERVLARLREKFPDADAETLERRARKFTEKIFPVFLTRETAMLRLLARDLPKRFRNRVPRVLDAQTDANGYVRTLRMNWLRNGCPIGKSAGGGNVVGGQPLSQLAFARQAAELLAALHDEANVMHLDLRLDNVVITQNGVGFVDFGSAVRVGENFPEASLLGNLFDEMMRTSQIQRMLGKMSESGQVTSEDICRSYGKIDKAVDFFYLAVQINNPHANPDFRGLVTVDKESAEARELAALTEKILRPADARNPEFKSARDIYNGILDIERRLGKDSA